MDIAKTQDLEAIAERLMLARFPFKYGGRGFADGGMDCLGVVLRVYGEAGIVLPDPLSADAVEIMASPIMACFSEFDGAKLRDLDLFLPDSTRRHVGVVIGGRLLQMTESGLFFLPFRFKPAGRFFRARALAE